MEAEELPRPPAGGDSSLDVEASFATPPMRELDEFREIVAGPLKRRVATIERRLDANVLDADRVAETLPEALRLHAGTPRLTHALEPSLREVIRKATKTEPELFIEAVYPTLGPAIRKAIASSLRAMIQSMNRALEHSFSLRGLMWRVEAWRTGRTFGEVVIRHTLLWRVEHVFLIHGETSLLLLSVHEKEGGAADNADIISGMLSAIQDFVRDSFDVEEPLQSMQVGDLWVWVERGPDAVIASVIRGDPPEDYRMDLASTVEELHLRFKEELSTFDGDTDNFVGFKPQLEECLQLHVEPPRASPGLSMVIIALLLCFGVANLVLASLQRQSAFEEKVAMLDANTGYVVLHSERHGSGGLIVGLRDPEAIAVRKAVDEVDPGGELNVRFTDFVSMDAAMIIRRARTALRASHDVRFKLDDGKLVVTGRARNRWLREAERIAPTLPGVVAIDITSVSNFDLELLDDRIRSLNQMQLKFIEGQTELVPGQDDLLIKISDRVRGLYGIARGLGQSFDLVLVGHTDSVGSPQHNLILSADRAEAVRKALVASGLTEVPLKTRGVGSRQPLVEEVDAQTRAQNRRVEFIVEISAL